MNLKQTKKLPPQGCRIETPRHQQSQITLAVHKKPATVPRQFQQPPPTHKKAQAPSTAVRPEPARVEIKIPWPLEPEEVIMNTCPQEYDRLSTQTPKGWSEDSAHGAMINGYSRFGLHKLRPSPDSWTLEQLIKTKA